jgi:putative flippase GtrA
LHQTRFWPTRWRHWPEASGDNVAMRILDLARWLQKFRYFKFGIVGATGTVVNIVVLYLAQNYVFDGIGPEKTRLAASLALAILIATLSNFTWNRLWTWADRREALAIEMGAPKESLPKRLAVQFGRYCMASWFGMAFQFGATIWLAQSMDYRLANILSIVAASVINFLANDRWTFRLTRKPRPIEPR